MTTMTRPPQQEKPPVPRSGTLTIIPGSTPARRAALIAWLNKTR